MYVMKCDEVSYLLVELSEGTISPENRKRVDEHVASCKRCTEDLALIRTAFETLRTTEPEDVPTHYFSNLIPRLRQRIEEKPARRFVFGVPGWAQRLLAPVSAAAVVVCMIGLYVTLHPANDSGQSQLVQLVSQYPKDEMDGVAEMASYSPVLMRTTELNRGVIEMLPNITLVSQGLDQQLVDDEMAHGHRLAVFLAADDSYEDITDEEVDSVIERLNQTTL